VYQIPYLSGTDNSFHVHVQKKKKKKNADEEEDEEIVPGSDIADSEQ